MILYDKSRYGLKPLYLITDIDTKAPCSAENAISSFVREVNTASDEAKAIFKDDIYTAGTYIDFTSSMFTPVHDMASVIHSVFPLDEVIDRNLDTEIPTEGNAALVEILSTGDFYFIYTDEYDNFRLLRVFDFAGTREHPTDVQVADEFNELDDVWIPVDPDASGTRLGGVPLNSDGTPYDGPWPITEDGNFSFIGQYQLEDGQYIHIFANYDTENYDYSSMTDDDITDPYTVALVEGQTVPAGVLVQYGGEQAIYSHDEAYAQKPCKSVAKYPPIWVQDADEPQDADWEFLLGYGEVQGATEIEFSGDFYLYWNKNTKETKVLMQCS